MPPTTRCHGEEENGVLEALSITTRRMYVVSIAFMSRGPWFPVVEWDYEAFQLSTLEWLVMDTVVRQNTSICSKR